MIINISQVSHCSSTDVLFEKEKTTKKKKKIKVTKKKQPDHCRENFYRDDDFVEWCAPRRQDDAASPAPAFPASPPPKPVPTFPDAACPRHFQHMMELPMVQEVGLCLAPIKDG